MYAANSCSYKLCEALPDIALDEPIDAETVAIRSDQADFIRDKVYSFNGNVRMALGQQKIAADMAYYYPQSEVLRLLGDIKYQTDKLWLRSSDIAIDRKNKINQAQNVKYLEQTSKANGAARRIIRISNFYTELDEGSYSTCPVPVGSKKQDWQIAAKSIKLDHAKGSGRAQKTTFKIRDVPVLYVPTFNFALDKRRKSGFLMPTTSYSSDDGLALFTPWYYNIKPNFDATITPGYISKRGLWLGTSLRYLNPKFQAKFNLEGISSDQLLTDKKRYSAGVYVNQLGAGKLSYNVDYTYVSDDDYLEDFKGSFLTDKPNYVNQQANLQYNGKTWYIGSRLYATQSLIDDSESYRYLPRVNFGWRPHRQGPFDLSFVHQYTRFTHADNSKITGDRLNSEISLSYSLTQDAFFLKPALYTRHTSYQNLENSPVNSASRTANTLVVDSGLFFEREFKHGWLQTLQPRLYYAYREQEDESALPDFDSSAKSFSMPYLFSPYTYSGKDLTGGLNRLSLGLGSDFIHPGNKQTALGLKFGQGYDFDTKEKTNLALEVNFAHKAWSGFAGAYLAADGNKFEQTETAINYRPNTKIALKTAYKYKKNSYNELDLSGSWRFNSNWATYARERRSLETDNNHLLERSLGFTYNSCCWNVKVGYARTLKDNDMIEYDDSIRVNFFLKGLGG